MSTPIIPADLANPGHFFACCGLLELATRRWPELHVEGHFNRDSFVLATPQDGSVTQLLKEFAEARCEQIYPADTATSPLRLLGPFEMNLNWWWLPGEEKPGMRRSDFGDGKNLKTWSGKQLAPQIFRLMKEATANAASAASPLDYVEAVFDSKDGKAKKKTVSPFYFDSRRESTSLDIGFSADEQELSVQSCPAVESLAMIGLQRFRPLLDQKTEPRSFVYTAWSEPLPALVASAAAFGGIPVRSIGSFRFTKPSRGGEYMTMFSRAKLT